MQTEKIEWWTPKERLPKDPSYNLMVKVEGALFIDWNYFEGSWSSDFGTQPAPDFWAYNPKGPR